MGTRKKIRKAGRKTSEMKYKRLTLESFQTSKLAPNCQNPSVDTLSAYCSFASAIRLFPSIITALCFIHHLQARYPSNTATKLP